MFSNKKVSEKKKKVLKKKFIKTFENEQDKMENKKHLTHQDILEKWKAIHNRKFVGDKYIFSMPVKVSNMMIIHDLIRRGKFVAMAPETADVHINNHEKSLEELEENYTDDEIRELFVKNLGLEFNDREYEVLDTFTKEVQFEQKRPSVNNVIKENLQFEKTYYLRSFKSSKLLWIGIDKSLHANRFHYLSEMDMLHLIFSFLKVEPIFISRGLGTDGLTYACVKFNDFVTDSAKLRLEKHFYKEHGFKAYFYKSTYTEKERKKYTHKNTRIAFPFSMENIYYGEYCTGVSPRINSYSIKDILEKSKDSEGYSLKGIKNLIGNIFDGKIIESNKIQLKEKNPNGSKGYEKYRYGYKTRYYNQIRLACWAVICDKSFYEYEKLAYELNDGTSKDMKNWSKERIKRELERYYYSAKKKGLTPKNTTYTYEFKQESGVIYDRPNILTYIEKNKHLLNKFRAIIKKEYNKEYTSNRSRGKWRDKFLIDTENLYKFLLRKLEYDKDIKKEYKNDKFRLLNQGTFIPKSLWKNLSSYLKLSTSISRIIPFLEKVGLIQKILINGKWTHSYKKEFYSVHYILANTASTIYRLYKEILHKHTHTTDNNKDKDNNKRHNTNTQTHTNNNSWVSLNLFNYLVNYTVKVVSENDDEFCNLRRMLMKNRFINAEYS